jgi:23S rRNA (uracil-5-)-methyltransferase RumA
VPAGASRSSRQPGARRRGASSARTPAARLTVTLTGPDIGGLAVADINGARVPVDGALPGETVELETAGARPGMRARAVRILTASPDRVVPRCRHAAECGGCDWQHVRYGAQLAFKQVLVASWVGRALGRPVAVAGTLPTRGPVTDEQGAPWGFRQKAHFVFAPAPGGGLTMGHYARGSRRVVAISECPAHAEAGNTTARVLRDQVAALAIPPSAADGSRGVVRHVVVRVGESRGERLATLVVTRDDDRRLRTLTTRWLASEDRPDGFFLNVHDRPTSWLFGPVTRHLHGRAYLREEVAGTSFLVAPTSFFQTNVRAAGTLVQLVLQAIARAGAHRVLDLYAGTGLFALPLARGGCQVIAVEESGEAVEAGIASRALNRVDANQCRFVRARAEDFVAGQGSRAGAPFTPDAVVLDPPREGCGGDLLARVLTRWTPALVVYVSCNPETLAADLGRLQRAGWMDRTGGAYRLDTVQPVDMFPHTAHVEVVATLRRGGARGPEPGARSLEPV